MLSCSYRAIMFLAELLVLPSLHRSHEVWKHSPVIFSSSFPLFIFSYSLNPPPSTLSKKPPISLNIRRKIPQQEHESAQFQISKRLLFANRKEILNQSSSKINLTCKISSTDKFPLYLLLR